MSCAEDVKDTGSSPAPNANSKPKAQSICCSKHSTPIADGVCLYSSLQELSELVSQMAGMQVETQVQLAQMELKLAKMAALTPSFRKY